MKEFKKFCWMAFAFCFIVLCASVNVSFAGPFGLFPNFTPFRTAGRVATAPFRAAGVGGCGASRREYRSGSCANGACQAPTQAPAKGPVQAK